MGDYKNLPKKDVTQPPLLENVIYEDLRLHCTGKKDLKLYVNSEEVDCEDVDNLDAVEQQRVLHLTSRERKRWHILLINNIKWNIKTKTDLYGELSFHLPWLVHLQLVDGRDDEGHCWDQDHCQGEERTKSEAEVIVIIIMNEITNDKNTDSCHISKEQY